MNDAERLALTDEQLDEQFWCIDPQGIPRLKSDQEKVRLPQDGLLAMLENVWQDNPSGEVEEPINYREILNEDWLMSGKCASRVNYGTWNSQLST
jgi:hypothetical protein